MGEYVLAAYRLLPPLPLARESKPEEDQRVTPQPPARSGDKRPEDELRTADGTPAASPKAISRTTIGPEVERILVTPCRLELRGYAESGVVEKIRETGGGVIGIMSEPQSLANEAELDWELPFACVGDPHHEILSECRERGWLSLFVNQRVDRQSEGKPWSPHPKGHFQPGVLAVSSQGRVLYRWRGRTTRQNLGGGG